MTSAGETFPSYIPELLFKVYIKTFFLEKSGEGLNPLSGLYCSLCFHWSKKVMGNPKFKNCHQSNK